MPGPPSPQKPSLNKNHLRGKLAEERVIEHYRALGFKIQGQRVKTPFAEVDLVLEKGGRILLVEVKSFTSFDFLPYRLGHRQRERLRRAFLFFQSRSCLLGLELAVVSQTGEVLIFTDVFS